MPAAAKCLLGVDFRFLSDEYREYVGSNCNDAFLAEVDESTWTVTGKVTYSTYQEQAANTRPQARATVVRSGTTVSLDASSSDDEDGTVASYNWYVETGDDDQVLTCPDPE